MSAEQQQKLVAIAAKRLETLRRQDAFDPFDLSSRPTAAQKQVIDEFGTVKKQWIRSGNQAGKTTTCVRLLTWFLTDTHPTWKRPVRWGNEPLLAVVAGRTGKQIEESLLPRITSMLEPGSYKEIRIGNIIQRLELTNGNRIVFQSLENPTMARERLQSYTAHIAWVDELPPTLDIVFELFRSVQAKDGFFLASFTPLVRNISIRKYVDSISGKIERVYRFGMLDNPVYADPQRKLELLDSLSHLPEHVRNCRLFGDWMSDEDAVYQFEYDKAVAIPNGYSALWRHVESVDPALKSALGYTLWAEDPNTKIWYCIRSKYFKGIYVPTALVEAVRQESSNVNVIRRISDPHEVWYIQTAAAAGLSYMGVHKKSDRKSELIKQYQEALGRTIRLTPEAEDLISETQECRWSERAEGKIVNASSYHLLDSAQYFVDNIPKAEKGIQSTSWQDWLHKANDVRKQNLERKSKSTIRRSNQWQRRSGAGS